MDQPAYRHLSEVAFADTDASGLAHFSKMLCYVEIAEHAFLASIGIPVFSNNEVPNGTRTAITDSERTKLTIHL